MGNQALIVYRDARSLTREMLSSARERDWDGLLEFEQKRRILLEGLVGHDASADAEAGSREQLAAIIRDILEADAEIKTLVEAWMGELQLILNSIGTEKKLNKAYESS